jgi:hypothetical protein
LTKSCKWVMRPGRAAVIIHLMDKTGTSGGHA